jgi:hypothetical protein
VVTALTIATPVWFLSLVAVGLWAFHEPERQAQLLSAAPYFITVAAILKSAVAVAAFRLAYMRGLLEGSILREFLVAWLVFISSAVAFVVVYVPNEGLQISKGFVVVVFVLFAPLARFALAPLAFEWNRHR